MGARRPITPTKAMLCRGHWGTYTSCGRGPLQENGKAPSPLHAHFAGKHKCWQRIDRLVLQALGYPSMLKAVCDNGERRDVDCEGGDNKGEALGVYPQVLFTFPSIFIHV